LVLILSIFIYILLYIILGIINPSFTYIDGMRRDFLSNIA